MRYILLLLLLVFTGCSSTIYSLPAVKDASLRSPERVVQHYFTPEAAAAVADIPTVNGFILIDPYVAGVNFWSSLAAFVTGTGVGRKVVVDRDTVTLRTLIHEYVHHIDDMDRDGEIDLISHAEFVTAWERLCTDPAHAIDVAEIKYGADRWLTDTFGIGIYSELIAYTAGWLVFPSDKRPPPPDYMWHVYRKILKRNRAPRIVS